MKINLRGKVALVCGSSQGIGKAIAVQLAYSGAKVILLSRNEDKLKEIVEDLTQKTGQTHLYITCDVSILDELEKKITILLNEIGAIHILVNNTGGPSPGLLYTSKVEPLQIAFQQHVMSAQKLINLILPTMIENHFGRIINIVSVGMREPIENLGVSNTIRGAMGSWAKTLSKELASFGITVNNILPGYTLTERLRSLIEVRAKNKSNTYAEEAENILKMIPARRFGTPEEIAYLATFLASEYSCYINGASIPIDGGFLSCI